MKTEFIDVQPKTGLIIGFTMLIAGILFVAWKANRISIELMSYKWNEESAIVLSSNFYSETSYSNSKNSTTYIGEFSYQYNVDGHEFEGDRYDAKGNMHTGLKSESEAIESKIKNDKIITIYYNPNSPSESLIKKGVSEDTWVRLCFSLFLILVGLVVIRYQLKRIKHRSNQ
jgi:hypothetical protein